MQKPILELKGLKKFYKTPSLIPGREKQNLRALDGVNLSLRTSQKLGIVGESGSGKSTLAKVILRLIEPTAGQISLLGQDITTLSQPKLKSIRENVQIIFQDPYSSLNPRMRIGQIIAEPLQIHTRKKSEQIRIETINMMASVGLTGDYFNRFPHQLSGGQRQRVGIARALILKPKIIVADEPVSALDVSVQAQLLNLLEDLHKEYNLTLVLISHDISVVQHLCDTIAVMYLGQIVEFGETDDLIQTPQHPYTEALISAVPRHEIHQNFSENKIVLSGDIPTASSPPDGCRFHTRCMYVKERCKIEVPQPKAIKNGHFSLCHYS